MVLLTVIYIDSFFLLNFCINYLLLLSAAKLAGEVFHRLRFALSAGFGAFYAAMTFFPILHILVHPVFKVSAAVLMILIAFGGTRRMFRLAVIFFALSCAFGGGLLALDFLRNGSYLQNGILHSALDFKGVLIAAGLFYGLLSLLFRRAAVHSGGELLTISFSEGDKSVKLIALRDSGNTLRDPITGRPVLVVEGEKLRSIFLNPWYLTYDALRAPIETLRKLSEESGSVRFRLLPYRAVGVTCGMLLTVRVERVKIEKQEFSDYLIALSPTPLSDGGGYCALIGS